jgi:hypothetical protein
MLLASALRCRTTNRQDPFRLSRICELKRDEGGSAATPETCTSFTQRPPKEKLDMGCHDTYDDALPNKKSFYCWPYRLDGSPT